MSLTKNTIKSLVVGDFTMRMKKKNKKKSVDTQNFQRMLFENIITDNRTIQLHWVTVVCSKFVICGVANICTKNKQIFGERARVLYWIFCRLSQKDSKKGKYGKCERKKDLKDLYSY